MLHQIRTYKRLTSLTVLNSSLSGSLKNLKDGDAIVTFSRASIFALKKHLETTTSFRAAVIYGSLPPEARAEQARLFNDPNSEYRILIASDAIGMGLNLYVIFLSLGPCRSCTPVAETSNASFSSACPSMMDSKLGH